MAGSMLKQGPNTTSTASCDERRGRAKPLLYLVLDEEWPDPPPSDRAVPAMGATSHYRMAAPQPGEAMPSVRKLDRTVSKDAFVRAGLVIPSSKLDQFFAEVDTNHDGAML